MVNSLESLKEKLEYISNELSAICNDLERCIEYTESDASLDKELAKEIHSIARASQPVMDNVKIDINDLIDATEIAIEILAKKEEANA